MNGIISESVSSNSPATKIVTSVSLGLCLFSGFFSGMHVSLPTFAQLNPFHTQTIHFDKISWITEANVDTLKLSALETPQVQNDLNFVPYELKSEHQKAWTIRSFRKPSVSNLAKLKRIVRSLQQPKIDVYADYQNAYRKFRQDFIVAVNGVNPSPNSQQVAMTASAAEATPVLLIKKPASSLARALDEKRVEPLTANVEVHHEEHLVLPRLADETTSAVSLASDSTEMNTQAVSIQEKESGEKAAAGPNQAEARSLNESAANNTVISPVSSTREAAASVDSRNTNFANYAVENRNEYAENTTELKNEASTDQAESLAGSQLNNVQTSTGTLTTADQKKLTDQLLNFQLMAAAKKQTNQWAVNNSRGIPGRPTARGSFPTPAKQDQTPITPQDAEIPHRAVAMMAHANNGDDCGILDNQSFIQPINSGTGDVNSQICPSASQWISKDLSGSGWVKLSGENHLSTLQYYPAPNSGSTLLINQNALALIALKTGIHITKGMGIIIGTVPEGYKVEFSGRAEETEYFETNGHSYFAILNVEPGAGVVELESKSNQNLNSTVFTPVLEDTVSYLDLSTPVVKNLPIQVVKSGAPNDPEVMNLTVGISTQSGIQAITQADGTALLKNVNLVDGYPLFIDVASKSGNNQSYTYRYELKGSPKNGHYVVNQIAEKSIKHWLKQVKQGLSDQSAMVVGFYDRKKRDGFKNHYFSKVEPLTSKFGLEPINYSILWDGKISQTEPLEGDTPRFMSVQVSEGLSQVNLIDESNQANQTALLPISPRVIHVISE